MRKYEKSLPTSNKVQEKIDELNTGKILAQGNADRPVQPAD